LRLPGWAVQANISIELNGVSILGGGPPLPGTFVALRRAFAAGDVIRASFGMAPRLEKLNDDRPAYASVYAILHGPLLLAGLTSTPQFALRSDPHKIAEWLHVLPNMEFTAMQSGAAPWTLRPLNRIVDETYTAYFNISLAANASAIAELCANDDGSAPSNALATNNPHSTAQRPLHAARHAAAARRGMKLTKTVAAAHTKVELMKTVLPAHIARRHNAYALDGSTYAYYIPHNLSSRDWVIYLEGGGECETRHDCHQRARSDLGSADNLTGTVDAWSVSDGILDAESYNPFQSWGKLYMPYLSGDDWLANMSAAADPWAGEADGLQQAEEGKKPLWFCGASNFIAAIEHWVSLLPAPPQRVLLSGGSAGGQGAYFHADRLQTMLATYKTRVKANPQYGWFEPNTDRYPDWLHHRHTDPTIAYPSSKSPYPVPKWMFNGVSVMLPPRCVAALPAGTDPMRCTSLPVVAQTVSVPLFVSTNLFDAWTTDEMQLVPDGKLGPTTADPKLRYLVTVTAAAIGGSVANVSKLPGDRGAFVPGCLAHQMDWSDAGTASQHSPRLGGCTHAEAVASWFFGTAACPRILIQNDTSVAALSALQCNEGRFRVR